MKTILLTLIRIYQKCVSPLFPRCCRYYPSCSEYARISIARFGAGKGFLLAASRLLRCHPWAKGGIDEVPSRFDCKQVLFRNKKREI